ncbi:MAG: phosphatase [Moraxellaceae bacterium]|nr:MAG: phosphatase [Moraxellaceae bacterium]
MGNLTITSGDIIALTADAIVCPSHKHLIRGRGLSAQIYDKAGDLLVAECKTLEECGIGKSKITKAYNLLTKYIIHTVTPQWSSGDTYSADELQLLRSCYQTTLQLAIDCDIQTLLIPALGAGTNRFPQYTAAHLGLEVIKNYIEQFEKITICLHSTNAKNIWLETQQQFSALKAMGN